MATYLNVSTEIWIAAVLLSSVDASLYSAGQRLALLLVLPLTALQVVFAPAIARMAVNTAEARSLEPLLRTGASVATVLCVALSLPMLVAPTFVLDLVYGPGFSDAAPILLLLGIGFFGNVATGLAGTSLSMLGLEGIAAKVQWSGALLRPALGVPAALLWGVMGLAVSAMAVSIFVFTAMWLRAHHHLGVFTHATLRPQLALLRQTPG